MHLINTVTYLLKYSAETADKRMISAYRIQPTVYINESSEYELLYYTAGSGNRCEY